MKYDKIDHENINDMRSIMISDIDSLLVQIFYKVEVMY